MEKISIKVHSTSKAFLHLEWNSQVKPMLLVLLELENSFKRAVSMEQATSCWNHTDLLMFNSVFITGLIHQYAGNVTHINTVLFLYHTAIKLQLICDWNSWFIWLIALSKNWAVKFYSTYMTAFFFYTSKQGEICDF